MEGTLWSNSTNQFYTYLSKNGGNSENMNISEEAESCVMYLGTALRSLAILGAEASSKSLNMIWILAKLTFVVNLHPKNISGLTAKADVFIVALKSVCVTGEINKNKFWEPCFLPDGGRFPRKGGERQLKKLQVLSNGT